MENIQQSEIKISNDIKLSEDKLKEKQKIVSIILEHIDDTKFNFDINAFSDLYKEVNGFRPSSSHEFYQSDTTNERRQEIWDLKLKQNDLVLEEKENLYTEAINSFENRISENINMGAENRENAIKWLLESEELLEEPDAGYICYTLGLPYSMEDVFKK